VLGGVALELEGAEVPTAALEADLLVLSAWTPGYERLVDRRDGPVVARWHSPLLQTELSGEGWKLAHLLELLAAGTLAGVAFDDADAAATFLRPGVVHLPNVFEPRELGGVRSPSLEGINVALSGEPYGRKNLLVQSAAFARAREDGWTLHLFGQTLRRSGYARWFELVSVPYVEHGFLPRDEYLGLAAGMDAALCASLAESFGYAAAEFVELGVPTVVSGTVACVAPGPLTVGEPSSVADVAGRLTRAVASPALVEAQRASLRVRAAENAELARAALARYTLVATRYA
jgi:glycosyltransferase involved in cell wall biosynthesis